MAVVPSIGRAAHVEPRPVAPEAVATHGLYERHAAKIHGYCLHQLGSREEAEDAVQTVFMNAFRALRKGVVPESEAAWLFKIAENVCLSRRRSSWRRGRIESPADFEVIEEVVAGPNRQRDELIGIEDALAGMPEQQRRAILLREWQGLSYREIADELEVSQSAVETLIFRARRSLAHGLEQPDAVKGGKRGLRRVRHLADIGSLLTAAKAIFFTGAAAQATATAVAVTATAGAVATVTPHVPRATEAPAGASRVVPAVVPPAILVPAPGEAPVTHIKVFAAKRDAAPAPVGEAAAAAAATPKKPARKAAPARTRPSVAPPAATAPPAAAAPPAAQAPAAPPVVSTASPEPAAPPATGRAAAPTPAPQMPAGAAPRRAEQPAKQEEKAAKEQPKADEQAARAQAKADEKSAKQAEKQAEKPEPPATRAPAAAKEDKGGSGSGGGRGKDAEPAPAATPIAVPLPAPVVAVPTAFEQTALATPDVKADAGNGNANGKANGKVNGK
ncbi:MAG TPA: sigma-70 family RNA polymerase sigma factor [Gaiellaceae bacterium]|nr:sigma-70 family RNA polymerase sigma factor [Gaiellaceae bacterium]